MGAKKKNNAREDKVIGKQNEFSSWAFADCLNDYCGSTCYDADVYITKEVFYEKEMDYGITWE